MDGAGFRRPPRPQHQCRFASESCKQHIAIHTFGQVAGKGRFASAGITEQAEDLWETLLEPDRNGLESIILLRRKFQLVDTLNTLTAR